MNRFTDRALLSFQRFIEAQFIAARNREYGRTAELAETARILSSAQIINLRRKENLRVGHKSVIRGELFVFRHGGSLSIGEHCFVGEQSRIWSAAQIEIGDRVLIAHGVDIQDNNTHPIDPALRHDHFRKIMTTGHPDHVEIASAPIAIHDDVWIGARTIVLKGVTIGARTIVAAGSLVTSDLPPDVLAAGSPAIPIRAIRGG